jgi:peroxiredoxin
MGTPAPDFTLLDLNDKEVTFKKDFDGEKTLLLFWATSCVNCKEEMRILEKVYKESKNKGFKVVSVNVYQDKDLVMDFAQELDLTFPVLLDKEGDVAEVYYVYGIPVSYVINGSGVINDKHIGGLAEEEVLALIEKHWS